MFWIYEGFAGLVAVPVTNIMLTVVLTLFTIGTGLAILYYGLPVLWRTCKWIFSGRAFRDLFAVCALLVYAIASPVRVFRMTRRAFSDEFDVLPHDKEKRGFLTSAKNQSAVLALVFFVAYIACFFIPSGAAVLGVPLFCVLFLLYFIQAWRINRKLSREFHGK